MNHLLGRYKQYGKVARPLFDSHDKIIVRFGLRLIQVDLIEKEQAMKASVWVRCVRIPSSAYFAKQELISSILRLRGL